MLVKALLTISIFQGVVLGVTLLKSPLFKSSSNKYIAYIIFILSILILSLLLEVTNLLDRYEELEIINDIEWALLLPVFVFLFIVHRVEHSIRFSKKIIWLYFPFLYSLLLNIINDLEQDFHLYTTSSSVKSIIVIAYKVENLLVYIVLFTITLWSFQYIRYANNEQEKKWIKRFWTVIFILIISWITLNMVTIYLFNSDLNSYLYFICVITTFLIHWLSYFGIYKYRLARDKKAISMLLDKNKIKIDSEKETSIDGISKCKLPLKPNCLKVE